MKSFVRPLISIAMLTLAACAADPQGAPPDEGRSAAALTTDYDSFQATSRQTFADRVETTLTEKGSDRILLVVRWNVSTGDLAMKDVQSGAVQRSQLLESVKPSERLEWANALAHQAVVSRRLARIAYGPCADEKYACRFKTKTGTWIDGTYDYENNICNACPKDDDALDPDGWDAM